MNKRNILKLCIVSLIVCIFTCGCMMSPVIPPSIDVDAPAYPANTPVEIPIYTPDSSAQATPVITPDITSPSPVIPTFEPNFSVDPNKPMVALTFDDGPSAHVTEKILDLIEQYGIRATFFVQGLNLTKYPQHIRRAVELGCEIGNHTKDHKKLTALTDDEIIAQRDYINNTVMDIAGVTPTLLRLPYGNMNERVRQIIGMPFMLWSIDTRDWESRNKDAIINETLKDIKDGDIILMHDLYTSTAEACEEIIPELINRGYQLVTVSEMFAVKGMTLDSGVSYRHAR
ncbi:MAG: polysaccharide deacetylase family protein [Christensenellales bacterium]|nr:polysaccharide deacetylase family protein [Christensenellales bacterium]